MTTLTRWNPFMQLDELFENVPRTFTPAADVLEKENAYEVQLDLPGIKPEEISVKLEGETLTISAERVPPRREEKSAALRTERSFGSYRRSFVLSDAIDGSNPEARYELGVLTVRLPKREEKKPKLVQVKVTS